MPQSAGQRQTWPPNGQGGYITRASWVVPNGTERGTKSEVALKLGGGLYEVRGPGDLECFIARDKIRGGPQMARVPA